MPMFNALLKIAAPLVLCLALVFISGVATASVTLAGAAQTDLCCPAETEQQQPATEGECTDPACICLSCSATILFEKALIAPSIADLFVLRYSSTPAIPQAPVRSIDYPPESV